MNKFAAGSKFLEVVKNNIDDFKASAETGRDHSYYQIRNRYRAIGVTISVDSNGKPIGSVKSSDSSFGLNYISPQDLEELLVIAKDLIKNEMLQRQIIEDQNEIGRLLQYYEDKENK